MENTISIKPTKVCLGTTWQGMVPVIEALLAAGDSQGREVARKELYRMARIADAHADLHDPVDQQPQVDLEKYCGVCDNRPILGYSKDGWAVAYYSNLVTHDTVLGYLAKNYPERLTYMDDHADATQRDGLWLMHRARERGLKVITVTAPPVLLMQDVNTVRAWPIELLAERFAD